MRTKLEKHIQETGIRVIWLSRATGIDYHRLRNIIRGFRPKYDEAIVLAAQLRKSVHELFDFEESLSE